MVKYYISDLHFGHEKILKFDGRPFKTVEENDNTIIKNWNNRITDDDMVFILGDVSYYDFMETRDLLLELTGQFFIIRGNHDKHWLNGSGRYESSVKDYMRITDYYHDKPVDVVLCHYPIAVWDKQFNGGLHLYGHIHNNNHEIVKHPEMKNSYNVGCMLPYMNYTPRTLDEIVDGS